MPKAKTLYFCQSCGAEFRQWFGRCDKCGEYDTLQEQVVQPESAANPRGLRPKSRAARRSPQDYRPQAALTFSKIQEGQQTRLPSGYGELDRVLGGGIVPGHWC